MKNYYDELEVSKTASKEVIGKVYKILAKKYHPDTTTEVNKQAAEEKFKIISEAYEILSDDEKRKKYDLELEQSNPTISYEDYINVVNQRDTLNRALNNLKSQFYQNGNSFNANNPNHNINTQAQYQYNQAQRQQSQYRQPNPNSNSSYTGQGYNMNQHYSNPNVKTAGKKYYYNTATGQPVSTFDYYKYRIKKFLSNIVFYTLLLVLILALIKKVISSGINDLLL